MITEDYCSYEVAKQLKEKGALEDLALTPLQTDDVGVVSKISHQMAMKWLREKHNVFIQIEVFDASTISGKHTFVFDYIVYDPYGYCRDFDDKEGDYPTYEQAVEVALKYSLENLI